MLTGHRTCTRTTSWDMQPISTNLRLLHEFRESDSYLNSDSSFSDSSASNSSSTSSNPFPSHLKTTLHKLARSLVQAASLVATSQASESPKVQLQFPRLRPGLDQDATDGRVSRTLKELVELGVDVIVGGGHGNVEEAERNSRTTVSLANPPKEALAPFDEVKLLFKPTLKINLDLSLLIALSSAIVHDELPPDGNPKGVYKSLVRK